MGISINLHNYHVKPPCITNNTVKFEPSDNSFVIAKTYSSIADMNANYYTDDVKIGEFVLIQSYVDDVDNAKLYVKTDTSYQFIVDLSGTQGMPGNTPIKGIDYWTSEDKTEIVENVLSNLPESDNIEY